MTSTPASSVESPAIASRSVASPEPASGFLARLWRAPWLLLSLTALFWSSNAVIGRAVFTTIPPVTLSFWRWMIAACVVFVFARARIRDDLPALRRHWPLMAVLAFLGISSFSMLLYWGLRFTTAINGVLMQSALPLLILAFAFVLYGDRPRLREIAGMVVAIAGVVVIVTRGSFADLLALSLNPGDLLILFGIGLYALYSALLRRRPSVHPLTFLGVTFALGALILLPLWLWELSSGARISDPGPAMLAIGYTAVFPSIVGYLCFNRGVELIGPAGAGQVVYLMPVTGSVLAVVFLGESFRPFHAAGVVLIAIGITMAQARPAPRR